MLLTPASPTRRPRRFLPVLASALALAVAACATPTPYQPLGARGTGASGGFSERQLEQNRFLVNFAGNELTSRERVETYLLYRAAELTTQQGYDWFVTDDRMTNRDTRTYVDRPFGAFGGWGGYWGPRWRYFGRGFGWRSWDPWLGDPFWGDTMDVRTVERFEASAEIVMGRGPKPTDNTRAFDARDVLARLGPTIELPRDPRRR
jgi:hypothetical protein